MTRLKLSVVLCTYNGTRHLQPQLESLLRQSRLPDQIVIGDDASSDGTASILARFVPRARGKGIEVELILRERNLGFVANFADSLARSSGEVLFLCDQDDLWYPDKLATMAERFEADPDLALLCSDARLVDAEGADLRSSAFEALELSAAERSAVHRGDAFDVLLRRSMVTGATAAFRSSLLPSVLPVGEGWIHDEWIAIVAAAMGRIDALEQALIDYRQHADNQVGMRRRGWGDRWRDLRRARGVQFRDEARRMESLIDRLASIDPVSPERQREAARRREHFATRAELGARSRWLRLPTIAHMAISGDYRRYGSGLRSVFRDLLRHD